MISLQKDALLQTRKQIFEQVEQGKTTVSGAAKLLGISRQALWYRRRLIFSAISLLQLHSRL